MKRACLLVIALVLSACGPKINPEYQKQVDQLLAKHAEGSGSKVGAPTTIRPQPWKVGQWTLYRTEHDGEVGYERLSIVDKDECGFWVEVVTQDYKSKSINKICYERMPFPTDDEQETVANTLDLVKKMVMKTDDAEPTMIDFETPQGQMMRATMQSMAQSMTFDWQIHEGLPRDTITSPGGVFVNAAQIEVTVSFAMFSVTSQSWVHPAVPINGSIRTTSSNGYESELIAYGQSGAHSEL